MNVWEICLFFFLYFRKRMGMFTIKMSAVEALHIFCFSDGYRIDGLLLWT